MWVIISAIFPPSALLVMRSSSKALENLRRGFGSLAYFGTDARIWSVSLVIIPFVVGALTYIRTRSILGAALLALIVTLLLSIRAEVARVAHGLRKADRELGSMFSLQALTTSGKAFPPLGDISLDAQVLRDILELIFKERPKRIVELGAGSSTLIMALLGSSLDEPFELISVEHDADHLRYVRSLFAYLEVPECQLVHAPLEQFSVGTSRRSWYSALAISKLPSDIDILIVDGPPNWKQDGARYHAMTFLEDKLANGAHIIVDDTDRRDERRMALQWSRKDNLVLVRRTPGHVILQRVESGNP